MYKELAFTFPREIALKTISDVFGGFVSKN